MCPECSGLKRGDTQRGTIEEFQLIAKQHGGECLSTIYKNLNTKLKFRCNKGHEWDATAGHVKSSKNRKGTWCPKCGNRHITIQEINNIAKERGGVCLTKVYTKGADVAQWRCSESHIWEAPFRNIIKGYWCPHCANEIKGNMRKLTIEDMHETAKLHGGKCLSKEYINSQSKLLWECGEGHQWLTKPNSVRNGSWCPYCSGNKKFEN
jgi:hypothetical protein